MIKNFVDIFRDYPKINGRPYTGAAYPPFEEEKINESEFEEENRYKSVDYTDYTDNYAKLKWISQLDNNGQYDLFRTELIRYYNYMAKKYNLTHPFTIEVYLEDRDHINSHNFTITVNNMED
ncbi:MAG: hypothetical protein IJZ36_03590 [Bacilli bacterium]|nr:hypothetical protein [Bacilli bacterium]